MDKTFAYWFEKLIGIISGGLACYLAFKYWNDGSALNTSKYYDIIIKASSSLFGFLLTILALTINGNNSNVVKMKEKGSFLRLVRYHKVVVLLAFILVVYSVVMYAIIESKTGVAGFISDYGDFSYKSLLAIHTGLSVWTAVDTILFVFIFYRILLTNNK